MPDVTPHLGLPLLAAGQAQKHVTHNEALTLLDGLVQLACRDKDLASPPANPAEGDRYLVTAAAPTGAWAGLSGQVVRFTDGVWVGAVPAAGWLAYVADEKLVYAFDGSVWASLTTAGSAPAATDRLGVNAQADATNRLAVKTDAAFLSWDDVTPGSGDLRVTVNKKAAAKDAGFVFQTGWSSRALFGTLGGDDFVLKTSPDGQSFHTALTAKAATGVVAFEASPTAPTPDAGDATTRLATTAFVAASAAAATARVQVSDAAYTIRGSDRTVAVIALTAARTLTLPAASAYPQGTVLTVMDESGACSGTCAVTIAAQGSDRINGLAATALVTPYGSLALQSNGDNKWTVNDRGLSFNERTFVDVAEPASTQVVQGGFPRITMQSVNSDPGGNWNATESWYTCPRRGIYQITASLRVKDQSSAGTQYGIGVYTAEVDGPWFLWCGVGPTPATRSTYPYSRLSLQSAGDRLRMFSYSDQGVYVSAAGLQICLVADAA